MFGLCRNHLGYISMSSDTDMDSAIALRSLTKRFGSLVAVNDLNLQVARGEVFGFLGLNGAGKTTTIRMLLDLLRPDGGDAFILGHHCRRDGLAARSLIGYLPGELGFYGDMNGLQFLNLFAGLSSCKVARGYLEDLLQRLDLPEADLHRKLREYSTGMKRKLGLIQAFQTNPPLLILDEPTEGLDPLMQESFYQLIFDVRRKGCTVFMSSHVLSEVERVCDRIGLIRKGKLVLMSPVDEIRKLAARTVRITFDADVHCGPDSLPQEFEAIEKTARAWTVRARGALGGLIQNLAGLPVRDLAVSEPRLEEILIQYFREDQP
jgi:ABC-2 type transport system ATP-binding protein